MRCEVFMRLVREKGYIIEGAGMPLCNSTRQWEAHDQARRIREDWFQGKFWNRTAEWGGIEKQSMWAGDCPQYLGPHVSRCVSGARDLICSSLRDHRWWVRVEELWPIIGTTLPMCHSPQSSSSCCDLKHFIILREELSEKGLATAVQL